MKEWNAFDRNVIQEGILALENFYKGYFEDMMESFSKDEQLEDIAESLGDKTSTQLNAIKLFKQCSSLSELQGFASNKLEEAKHSVESFISRMKDEFNTQLQLGMQSNALKYLSAVTHCSKLSRELPELIIQATIEDLSKAYILKNKEVEDQVKHFLEKRD